MSTWAKGGWSSLDEKGFSWAETMLSLMIIFMLFGTLMPLMQKMQQTLYDKQMRMTAYETMHEAARTIHATGLLNGQRMVNGTLFSWEFETGLCVTYTDYREEQMSICEE